MKLFNGMTVENNELAISGVTVSKLRRKYGTPLYVYDEKRTSTALFQRLRRSFLLFLTFIGQQ